MLVQGLVLLVVLYAVHTCCELRTTLSGLAMCPFAYSCQYFILAQLLRQGAVHEVSHGVV